LNCDPASTCILSPNNKPLPFKGSGKLYNEEAKNRFFVGDLKKLRQYILSINEKAPHIKLLVIEDLTHYLNRRVVGDAGRKDYDKWTELAAETFQAVVCDNILREDLHLVVIGHTQENKSGVSLQTAGKMLEEKINLPSYFTVVLHSVCNDGKYSFLTQHSGDLQAKSPEGMFEQQLIENDLAEVVAAIDNYYA